MDMIQFNDGRVLTIYDEITNENMKEIMEAIVSINMSDDSAEVEYLTQLYDLMGENLTDELAVKLVKEYCPRKPIQILINSGGGSYSAGLGVIEAIRTSLTPVHTIAMGYVASMALKIFLMGDRRFMSELSTLMYHELAYSKNGNLTEHSMSLDDGNEMQVIIDSIVTTQTKATQEKLDEIKASKSGEWNLYAKEALELEFAHEII